MCTEPLAPHSSYPLASCVSIFRTDPWMVTPGRAYRSPRPYLEPGPGLRVATVVAHPGLEGRLERPVGPDRERAPALEQEPNP